MVTAERGRDAPEPARSASWETTVETFHIPRCRRVAGHLSCRGAGHRIASGDGEARSRRLRRSRAEAAAGGRQHLDDADAEGAERRPPGSPWPAAARARHPAIPAGLALRGVLQG